MSTISWVSTLRVGVVVMAVTAVAACGHSDEWQYGYSHTGDALGFISAGVSAESACRSVAGIGYGRTNGVINSQDAYDGCMTGLSEGK